MATCNLRSGDALFSATADTALNDGRWKHLLVEVDRQEGVTFHVDARKSEAQSKITLTQDGRKSSGPFEAALPVVSLSNSGDFLVGGGPGQQFFAGTLDFLRVARGTLADAQTTIEELYAWQFNGPHLADFAGTPRTQNNAAGALVSR